LEVIGNANESLGKPRPIARFGAAPAGGVALLPASNVSAVDLLHSDVFAVFALFLRVLVGKTSGFRGLSDNGGT
jgi:hypothetical protein